MDAKKIGTFLKELRKEKGLTQEQLADELHVLSKTVSRWETARTLPDLETLLQLASFYNVELRELIEGCRFSADEPETRAEETIRSVAAYSEKTAGKKINRRWIVALCAAGAVLLALLAGYLIKKHRQEEELARQEGTALLIGEVLLVHAAEEKGQTVYYVRILELGDLDVRWVKIGPDTFIDDELLAQIRAEAQGERPEGSDRLRINVTSIYTSGTRIDYLGKILYPAHSVERMEQ